ncbi:MAG: rhomboid family intramembrane serine protease [Flavobacteriales bacterium]
MKPQITENKQKPEKASLFQVFSKAAKWPFFIVLLMFLVHFIEFFTESDFHTFGLYPRRLEHLMGLFFSPFLHGSWDHLFGNITSFFGLSVLLLFFYPRRGYTILFLTFILSGFLAWIGVRSNFHIGASGWVYALAFYLFFNALFDPNRKALAISFVVVMFYGSMIWGILPLPDYLHISWDGHFFGALTGLILAYLLPGYLPKVVRDDYSWEKEQAILTDLEHKPVIYEEVMPSKESSFED